MPKSTDIRSILIIGSGPIIIGQACEFDYSGTQACRVLKEEGYRVLLVNSNPATIMTDPEIADATYIEPITPEVVERIIAKERPDALLPTLGGQTALNTAVALAERGVLDRYGVRLIGANLAAIKRAEDREEFRRTMQSIGMDLPDSRQVASVEEAVAFASEVGLPLVVRPSFTLGGLGGGMARTMDDLKSIVAGGVAASPVGTVLLEQSVEGWKEFELEVMRDRNDNVVIICSIENFDAMGVHTGDSITVAPAQTLTDREYQALRDKSIAIIRAIGVETGGSNIQFAVNPKDGRQVVIEMNPRVSRSSALASKATGYPIAKIAARLAVGYTLDEIVNDITKKTKAAFEPTIDYCVVKLPRWAFEKFPRTDDTLGTRMKSVGEVMAIGRTFSEAFLKGMGSLEIADQAELRVGLGLPTDLSTLMELVKRPTWRRPFEIFQALRQGATAEELQAATGIDRWFLDRMAEIVVLERAMSQDLAEAARREDLDGCRRLIRAAKRMGMSDWEIAHFTGGFESDVRAFRLRLGIVPTMKAVDTCAAEFPAFTPYFYSTYESEDEGEPLGRDAIVILGSGPNRIGQGIEFDYCCVQACRALRQEGYRVIMVNSNPETVSTDYDTSDRLFFEPLSVEHVLNIIDRERPLGVILQLGGQTPLKLAGALDRAGIRVLGTQPDDIDRAENRDRFRTLVEKLGLTQPTSLIARTRRDAVRAAERIGFPILVRPSWVLGGRGMRILHDAASLELLLDEGVKLSPESPLLIDQFLQNAVELDVDAVSDGQDVLIGAVMEHIEEAGVHSGDSSCVIPPYSVGEATTKRLADITRAVALELKVVGLLNVQFAILGDRIYVIEVNPRGSRTIPFASKAVGLPLARIATRVMAGRKLAELGVTEPDTPSWVSVKKAVLPFERFPGEDTLLGPEMKSTGEVMGIGEDFGRAYAKAQLGSGEGLPMSGTVFVSIRDADKRSVVFLTKKLVEMGFSILATRGTARFLKMNGIIVEEVRKVVDAPPNVMDLLLAGRIQMVINTPEGGPSQHDDQAIRMAAVARGIPVVTTIPGAMAAVSGIEALRASGISVTPLQAVAPVADY
jgi:carbamoyl-phosphate synthase large subunit